MQTLGIVRISTPPDYANKALQVEIDLCWQLINYKIMAAVMNSPTDVLSTCCWMKSEASNAINHGRRRRRRNTVRPSQA